MEVSTLVTSQYREINTTFVYTLHALRYTFIPSELSHKIIRIILNSQNYYEFNEKIWHELISKNHLKSILLNFIVSQLAQMKQRHSEQIL